MARQLLRHILGARLPAGRLDDAEVMISELVTNAATHTGDWCSITLSEPADGVLRIGVCDHDDALPISPLSGDPLTETGRGLRIVDALSVRWGVELAEPVGKTVWFEIPC